MCEFNDEAISHDPDPFSTVPPPSGPSGSSEPQDSITANPFPKQSWEAGPAQKHDNPQKRKGATVTGEPEELENSPSAKRVQPEQHSIPSPVETPVGTDAHPRSSSPLRRLSWEQDLQRPSTPAERQSSTPSRYPSPSFVPTTRPIPDLVNSTHTPTSRQSTEEQYLPQGLEHRQDEQGIPNQGVSGPSREPENVPFPLTPLEKLGKAVMLKLENVAEKDRNQLVQLLVLARPQEQRSCSAEGSCLYRSVRINVLGGDHKRYLIKINWPQVTSGEGADRTADVYHKLFPKMVGDSNKVGLMAREWLKYKGNVLPAEKMFQVLEEIKPTLKPGDDLAELWRLQCDLKLWHAAPGPCVLSYILDMGDTYVGE
ncbi:hypothetical protein FPHYL_1122 [Fusarium phyllophilum]|uniref:Uncharacterized protein n=1 Tax=Fusarium phyllophilum TaxID=47803 RepID=A0A8H5NMY9_9HYPO|nr:hypothetical protein FPHYL_1122 [Fusarium phyllophilum]